MHHYAIIPDENLVVITFEGDLVYKNFIELIGKIGRESSSRPDYALVIDFRNARILFSLTELKEAAELFLTVNLFRGRKAMLVNRSVDTAKLMIFRGHVGEENHFNVFSTIEAASSFIDNDLYRYLDEEVGVREDVYI